MSVTPDETRQRVCALYQQKPENKRTANCYFDLIENSETRKGDTFTDFAELVLNKECGRS